LQSWSELFLVRGVVSWVSGRRLQHLSCGIRQASNRRLRCWLRCFYHSNTTWAKSCSCLLLVRTLAKGNLAFLGHLAVGRMRIFGFQWNFKRFEVAVWQPLFQSLSSLLILSIFVRHRWLAYNRPGQTRWWLDNGAGSLILIFITSWETCTRISARPWLRLLSLQGHRSLLLYS